MLRQLMILATYVFLLVTKMMINISSWFVVIIGNANLVSKQIWYLIENVKDLMI